MDEKKRSQKEKEKEKGNRLKNIRGIANLSRLEMSRIVGVSVHTLKSWELGKFSGISEKGARQVVDSLRSVKKINCDLNWLLNGSGDFPSLCSDHKYCDFKVNKNDEKNFFLKSSSDHYILLIEKNISSPFLVKGNEVGLSKIEKINDDCIGKYICVESRAENVIFGLVVAVKDEEILLSFQDNVFKLKTNTLLRQGRVKRVYIT